MLIFRLKDMGLPGFWDGNEDSILWNCNFKIEDYGKKEDSGQKSLCMVRDYFV